MEIASPTIQIVNHLTKDNRFVINVMGILLQLDQDVWRCSKIWKILILKGVYTGGEDNVYNVQVNYRKINQDFAHVFEEK